ncbi:hypothetical protein BISA_1418 [Bifidobacterium saguini DSM 23967]|uniref:Uncharacterized protein n=2 Tax=Bifidobacterium saguini TaxID=762210 RepID=A0A087DCT2_9BIFI|nr:hypothetical protein [Bifidobacterium saguini]KFI93332.1 hypothetical protein BISA_1418 [Bifidobacterium saguini DSM 23967]QTB90545.1 hypothetical protein BSD967_09535 [Bifidobacterium saguini]
MVEHTHAAKKRLLTLPSVTIPAEVIRMDTPEYIKQRLQKPVAKGQLWMAKTNIGHQYVLVSNVTDDARIITVIPMSNNTAVRTDDSLIVRNTPLCSPMVAWPALATEAPVRILFRPLDEFTQAVTNALTNDCADDTLGVERATAPEDPMTSAEQEIFEIRKRMEAWHQLCNSLPKLHDDAEYESTDSNRMDYVRLLTKELKLPLDKAIDVIDGRLALSAAQQNQLAKLGINAELLRPRTFSLPKDLLIEIEQPVYRSAADNYASAAGEDSRLALAKDAFALAARKNGYGPSAWRGVIKQAIDHHTSISE